MKKYFHYFITVFIITGKIILHPATEYLDKAPEAG